MLMKRRKPPTLWESFRIFIWPRRSWLRSGQYVTKRILRITASPHAVAAGVAAGAFTSFTPFMGLHFIIAFALAWLVRGNLIASALGTFVGNPLTFPLIWAAAYKTGHFILQSNEVSAEPPALGGVMSDILDALWRFDFADALSALGQIWTPVIYPMLVGGTLVGLLIAMPIYFLTRRAALLFRENRRQKLMAKASEIHNKTKEIAPNANLAKEA